MVHIKACMFIITPLKKNEAEFQEDTSSSLLGYSLTSTLIQAQIILLIKFMLHVQFL